MANTFITPSIVAQEALMALQNRLLATKLVYRNFEGELVNKKAGDTITVRKPAVLNGRHYFGSTVTKQNITESSVDVKLDRWADITVPVSSKQWTLEIVDFVAQVVNPAIYGIADTIDREIFDYIFFVAGKTVKWSSSPVLGDLAELPKALDNGKAPKEERYLVMSNEHYYKAVALEALYKTAYAGTDETLRKAVVGDIYGMMSFQSQNIIGPTNALNAQGTITAVKGILTAGSANVTLSSGSPATGTFKAGDIIVCDGLRFTASDDVTLSSSAGTFPGQLDKGEGAFASTTTATDCKVVKYNNSLAFQRKAVAFVSATLSAPQGANSAVATDPETGLGIRVVFDWDKDTKEDVISFDLIYGVKVMYKDFAAVLEDYHS